ncbi:hypothetical protein CYMTET_18226 [Cymbomonas tetramitiformis]|uniref:Reverse transcriptase domain-containing protein n=1 Tax=Cymbomonas tetramitiformis TaxID=36881 RepID=A0AAE0G8J4_9CHLO|nr:hypothetical protein CYMTET_18226 [Cymbomonas tetramitiformis]
MLQLRASMESDATSHGGAEALRAKLAFIEEKVYAGSDGLVSDSVLTKWLKEFDTTKAKAVMNTHAKASAKVSTFRDRQGGKGKGAAGGGAGKGEGGRGSGKGVDQQRGKDALGRQGAFAFRSRSVVGRRHPSATGVDGRRDRAVSQDGRMGTSEEATTCIPSVLGAEAGDEQVASSDGLPLVERALCQVRCKMETLKKLRRLAKPNDWCISFDLQDGYHVVGINPAFQEYMHFDVRGELFQSSALPFGWNDSPRIFVKVMKVLVECLRSLRSAEDRQEVRKPQSGSKLVEHLGLEVDLKAGQFRVTSAKLQKIHLQSKALLSEASRQRRELHFVLSTRRGWGAKVKLTRQAWSDIEWWLRLPAQSRWNGRKIWRNPTRAKVHTDASLFAWGGVLNLEHAARGFWSDELRHLHITHLELEAVYKTVQSFVRELTGKVVRLYCDNQAVVAMLSHFTSRNLELMRRMRRLWILLDLNDIELQASGRSGNGTGSGVLGFRVYVRVRFASELSAQLPRYYAQWHDPGCEGVDSLAFSWLGEVNWVNPPLSLLDEVAHKLREERCPATVVAPYWPGQMWFQQLEAMADEVVILPRSRDLFTPSRPGGSELLGASSWDGIMFRISGSR